MEALFSEGMVEGGGTRSRTNKENPMKTKSNVKAGGLHMNHNQAGLKVASKIKAGGLSANHNQAAAR